MIAGMLWSSLGFQPRQVVQQLSVPDQQRHIDSQAFNGRRFSSTEPSCVLSSAKRLHVRSAINKRAGVTQLASSKPAGYSWQQDSISPINALTSSKPPSLAPSPYLSNAFFRSNPAAPFHSEPPTQNRNLYHTAAVNHGTG